MNVTRKTPKTFRLNRNQIVSLEQHLKDLQKSTVNESEKHPDESVVPVEIHVSFEEVAKIRALESTKDLPSDPKENEGYQIGNDYWVFVNGEWVTRNGTYGIEHLHISGEFIDDKSNSPKRYVISGFNATTNNAALDTDNLNECVILMQNGVIPQVGRNGVTLEELLTVCKDVLESYQAGPFECKENQVALNNVNSAISVLQSRTKRRINEGTEGTYQGN